MRQAVLGTSVLFVVAGLVACGSDKPEPDPEPVFGGGDADVSVGDANPEPDPTPGPVPDDDIEDVEDADEIEEDVPCLPENGCCKKDSDCNAFAEENPLDDCFTYICDLNAGDKTDEGFGECVDVFVSGCCTQDSQCVGKVTPTICETPACINNKCKLKDKPECCLDDEDCEDLDDGCCNSATCGGDHLCHVVEKADCCADTTDCDDGLETTTELCENACEEDGCLVVPNACAKNIVYLNMGFDDGQLGLTLFDNNPGDNVSAQVVTNTSVSPLSSVYIGDPACQTYYSGAMEDCVPIDPFAGGSKPLKISLTTKELALDGDSPSFVGFWVNMCVEKQLAITDPQTGLEQLLDADFLALEAISEGKPTEIWRSTDADAFGKDNCTATMAGGPWFFQTANLQQFQGKSITLRFTFTTDGGEDYNTKPGGQPWYGVYLDNLRVGSMCGATFCDSAAFACPDDLNACTQNTCTMFAVGGGGVCGFQTATPGETCQSCGQPKDCGTDSCFDYACDAGICDSALKPECCAPASTFPSVTAPGSLDFEGFEDANLFGWTIDDPFTDDTVSWQVHDVLPFSGAYALYFGDPATETYESDKAYPARATAWTPAFQVPASLFQKTIASMWLWLSTEYDGALVPPAPDAKFDLLTILVEDVSTGAQKVVWSSVADLPGSTNETWTQVGVDLSAWAGAQVRLGFHFDSVDATKNDLGGARIDDLTVSAICAGECVTAKDCDDDDPCTVDWCDLGSCENVKEDPLCCTEKEDCNDGNNCTLDACEEGQCQFEYDLGKVGTCCSEGPWVGQWTEDFESGAKGWTVENLTPPVVWHLTQDESHSPTKSYNFSDPDTGTYDLPGEEVEGRLISKEITVPPFKLGRYFATFWFLLETEWDVNDLKTFDESGLFTVDDLTVEVENVTDGGKHVEKWWSGYTRNTTLGNWLKTRVDLSGYKGKTVRLHFRFDSGDSKNNKFAGPFIDDVSFGTTCKPDSSIKCIYGGDCKSSDPTCKQTQCSDNFLCVESPIDDPLCCEPFVNDLYTIDFEDCVDGSCLSGGYDFEQCTAGGGTNDPDVKWSCGDKATCSGIEPQSGTKELCFSNGTDYGANLASCGSACTPCFTLSADHPWSMKLNLYADIEKDVSTCIGGGPSFSDVFKMEVRECCSDKGDKILSKTNAPVTLECNEYGKWIQKTVLMDKWAGQSIQLCFTMDTWDGFQNFGKGIAVDKIEFTQGCPEAP